MALTAVAGLPERCSSGRSCRAEPDTEQVSRRKRSDWGEGLRPHSGGERKSEDYYTVLILGRDTGGGGNTDTMLLASYDVTNQKATVMSIPRDTMVNVAWDMKTHQLRLQLLRRRGPRASRTSTRRSPSWWALSRTTR